MRGNTPTSGTIGRTVFEVAAVDALAGVENVPAHDLAFELLEHAGDTQLGVVRILRAFGAEMRQHLVLDGVDRLLALGLAGIA